MIASDHARWILTGATLHGAAGADALGVEDGRIAYVGGATGARAWAGGHVPAVAARGLFVYPGLVDAHAHLYGLGRGLEEVDLLGAASLAEALERVRRAAATLPVGAWVLGRGWNETRWAGGPAPTAALLDETAGGRPVYLARQDGHAAWISSAVLAQAGVTSATRDPDGGRIVRDAAGAPTGVLIDHAMELAARCRPEDSPESIARRLLRAQAACARVGLTGMHDMGDAAPVLAALRRLDERGELALRVEAAIESEGLAWEEETARGPQLPAAGRRLTVRAAKLFADGALGSGGAALLEPYADEPGNRGLQLLGRRELEERLARAVAAGFQPCVHAIGDRANRTVLDAMAKVLGPAHPLRPRIEHCQIVDAEDLDRFRDLGVVASMQPIHCTSDMGWAEARLGRERCRGAYAWREMLARGVPLAFGSDFPVEAPDPRLGLFAAVTRQRADGTPAGGWFPEQRLSAGEALAAFTAGAAFACRRESELGRIAPGFLADLTLLDRDLESVSAAELAAANVWATVTGGRVTYAAEPGRWGGAAPAG